MLISYNWLKKYVGLVAVDAKEVADKLKATTVEVESLQDQGELLQNIVIGKVVVAEKHPNADKLKLCKVDVGNEELQIVCGGSNVREGMLVAVAKVDAKVQWHGEDKLTVLKPTKIRGEDSFGMICASTEIGLGELFPLKDEKEILDLTEKNYKVGLPLAEVLGLNDWVFEVDNKSLSNRGDLWGHYGMAREVAVLYNRDLQKYETKKINPGKDFKLEVEVAEPKLCSRYMAVAMSGINVGPSPLWLQEKLMTLGHHPINNIVDITNYIMLDLGQPMHAFDSVKVEGKIIVRLAKSGEKIIALDKNEYELKENDLVIADNKKALAIAGVMGGSESAIDDGTVNIIFESANFNAINVRKTSTHLNLRSDSSMRFEKSLDPNMCEIALQKAVELVLECCPEAKVISKVVDKQNFSLPVGLIEVPLNIFEKKLGVVIPEKDIINILERLGFEVKSKKENLFIKIPTWRAVKDVSIAEDLVEEVARFFGYNNIPAALPSLENKSPLANPLRNLEKTVAMILVKELGYTEVYNYSFVGQDQITKLGDGLEKYLELDNPLSKERPFLRRNLLPNLLENIKNNIEYYSEVKIFEIGKIFSTHQAGARADSNGDGLLPKQDTWLATMFAAKKEETPFWQARHVLESIFAELHLQIETLPAEKIQPWEHPTRLALVSTHGKTVGIICEINPLVSQGLGIEQRVGVLQINLTTLSELLEINKTVSSYRPASGYPEVVRDLAFLVKKEVEHSQILASLPKLSPIITNVELFDVYEGIKIGEGYKSMGYSITLSDPKATLITVEVDVIMKNIQKFLEDKFGAEMR
ncbi:MAG: phenylalanine--tRNA ligase subunit beta [Candidatus Magasanikbacteria bacterium RIFOXYD2_FULL_36_9]|uniref:Phenylalanine--tRNA ligase beta subunit n=1 Tax=Candidatus Magasanikbacteria bacterium RIFOXYD2_FULL_36_9 TaxID=1798707 RepID=A0A1F6P244_9BACT|nr:MAG: phenylalanine--tRNA ligase subunit beta [Candidatus Magasanikbacteria bacterium RIFOXYD2_FULL_36_9]